ncbi:hypothetical protein [Rhizobium sp. K102]|uniref:hypothetical protein n=1 Tax=Rhizobium sp. K102 TaxID=2918527 RepID=UPI001EFBBD2E|nr:hypothetical protein [Rhizobium sp. K102]ULR43645.1 hypothetical protein MHI61_21055 [Rhizobium sp. K102]
MKPTAFHLSAPLVPRQDRFATPFRIWLPTMLNGDKQGNMLKKQHISPRGCDGFNFFTVE